MGVSILEGLERREQNPEQTDQANVNVEEAATLEDALLQLRGKWSKRVKALTRKLGDFEELIDLQYAVYNLRQDAVDYYYYMLGIYQKQYKEYSRQYKDMFVAYKTQNSVRYSSESVISNLVEGELSQEKYTIKLLDNQVGFMRETVKTIDNIIFGIKNRIDIQKMNKEMEF